MHEPTITFTGHLAAKPAIRPVETPQGPVAVAKLRVAVTPRRRGRDAEEWTDGETIWFDVSTWRNAAANVVASLNQGDRVLVRGKLTQRTWRDAEGVERPAFQVDAEDVALDVTRHPAMSLRRTPAQRQGGEAPAEADRWAPTGEADDTGAAEAALVALPEPDDAAAPV